MKKKCYVNYLGCEKRKLDAQRIIDYLRKNGCKLTTNVSEADIVVFVTCAFCEKYEDWSISKMSKIYRRRKAGALFAICGCLPSIHPERLGEFPDAIRIPTRRLEDLDNLVAPTVSMCEIPDPNVTVFDGQIHDYDSERPKTRAQQEYELAKIGFKIRIDWGCLGRCAYCVTRLAEGSLTSKPRDVVLAEFDRGLKSGHRSFFLTGGDAGAYGIDRSDSIVSLLREILAREGAYRIHFQDFGVHWLRLYSAELLPLLESNPDKAGCFCLPVQSGSDKILKSMRRPYEAEEIAQTLLELKRRVPALSLGTHFLVGFPGETEEDFQKSIDMVRRIPFDFVNVFPYTDHSHADSHAYPDKVPVPTILDRYQRLFHAFEAKQAEEHG